MKFMARVGVSAQLKFEVLIVVVESHGGSVSKADPWPDPLLGGGSISDARGSLFPAEHRVLLAVLPIENIGGNPQEAFFADGLHQDMISVLNRLYPDRLGVIAQ